MAATTFVALATVPVALPAGPRALRSGGNPQSIRRILLLLSQFPHVLQCGTTARTPWSCQARFKVPQGWKIPSAGEHDGLMIAVALAGWWGDRLTWGDDMLDRMTSIDEGDDESR